ncbi:MAG: T9SS type A sorting domain-containing protein [Saprospiraceae bacterium]|nr:T9SS type A sorting domain-containing protein [Saprospiraceae bacterium]
MKVEVDINQTGTLYSEIVNASGMVVCPQPIGSTVKQGKQIFTIDTKDLVDGSYVLKIKNAKTTVLKKFVVIK